jgi:hypothetical protein
MAIREYLQDLWDSLRSISSKRPLPRCRLVGMPTGSGDAADDLRIRRKVSMALAGVVVEYLVLGSLALLWISIGLVAFEYVPPAKVPEAVVVALVPSIYVLGMLSDFVGRSLVQKKRIEKKVQEDFGAGDISSQELHANLVAKLPALAQELDVRGTRDRIARGALANVPFLALAIAIWMLRNDRWSGAVAAILVGGSLYFVVYLMWRRFQTLSARYEVFAHRALEENSSRNLRSAQEIGSS